MFMLFDVRSLFINNVMSCMGLTDLDRDTFDALKVFKKCTPSEYFEPGSILKTGFLPPLRLDHTTVIESSCFFGHKTEDALYNTLIFLTRRFANDIESLYHEEGYPRMFTVVTEHLRPVLEISEKNKEKKNLANAVVGSVAVHLLYERLRWDTTITMSILWGMNIEEAWENG